MTRLKTIQITEIDIGKLCRKAGISLAQLAREAGVAYSHLSKVKNGHYSMSPDYWEKLKDILDKHNKK